MQLYLFRIGLLPALFIFVGLQIALSQCPTLNQTATMSMTACEPNLSPCHLCPGEQVTLTASGTNLNQIGNGCVNWYYGTSNNFNPYNGEGTLLGCSQIDGPPPPVPCNDCPINVLLFVDACGTEADNEWMVVWSGSGFNVDQATLDFDASNNVNPEDSDVNGGGTPGCNWQDPTANALASVQSFCAGATVVGVGPGDNVPANVPVIVYTSSSFNFNYNWGALCPLAPTIYVMQNGCDRTAGAFSNATSAGVRTTIFSLDCGCSDASTYNTALLSNTNGAFFSDVLGVPIYGNAGCGFPSIPGWNPPPPPPPVQPDPFTATITSDMCNQGPFWIVGVLDPLPAGCPDVFTNYIPYNVVCPDPMLSTGQTCQTGGLFDLNQLEDPNYPNGIWAGPGVVGTNFNPTGQSGDVNLTFTPSGPCAIPVTTTVTVSPQPNANFEPVGSVCAGSQVNLSISLTGTGPWTFTLLQNGVSIGDFQTSDSPFTWPITVNSNTTITLENLEDANCTGQDDNLNIAVTPPMTAELDLIGPGQVCPGESTTLAINFTGGSSPYTFIYSINGIDQAPISTDDDPYVFTVEPTSDVQYELVSAEGDGCLADVSGTAFVSIGDAPSGSLNGGSSTICEGGSVVLTFNFVGTPPFTFTYSENGLIRPAITTNSNTYNITVTPSFGNNIYQIESVTGGGCSGDVAGDYSVIVEPEPVATLSGTDAICGTGIAEIRFDFEGTGPYTVQYEANGDPQTPFTTNSDPFFLQVSPSVTTTYSVTAMTGSGCTGQVGGTAMVTVANPLSATLSGGGQICQGGNGTTLTVNFNGDGPYTFVYAANNVQQPPVTTNQDPFTFPVNPASGTIYSLVSVSNSACTGTVSGTANVFVFTPPTADLIPVTQQFCNSANTNVEINLTGTGPFTITYAINGQTQAPVQTFDDPYFIPVNVTSTTTYTLAGVQSPGCTGVANGSTTVEVNFPPSFANLDINCNQVAGTYTVEFDVINGEAPYTLVAGSNPGTFNAAGHFTSAPINLPTNYNIVFHDNNNCGNVAINGTPNCNCITNAGTMSQTLVTACFPSPAVGTYNNNPVLDNNDSLRFILHTDPALPVGQILAWSESPVFPFIPATMQVGEIYYISAIAGNPDATGNVILLTDPCVSVALGQPVRWIARPTVSFLPDTTRICPGQSAQISVVLGGFAPFNFTYEFNGSAQPPVTNLNASNYTINLSPTQTTLITIASLADQFCTNNNIDSQAVVIVGTTPEVLNLQTICDQNAGTYIVQFDIQNGTPPYTISGLTGTFTGNQFVSVAQAIGDPYSFTLSDASNCGEVTRTGVSSCGCVTNAGTMSLTPLNLCINQLATATFNNDEALPPGSVVKFILHTVPQGPPVGTILAWGDTPDFSFMPGITVPGTTYYISSIAGTEDLLGNINLNDPCISVSEGVPVVWQNPPIATLTTPNLTVCPGTVLNIPFEINGNAPFTLQYASNGNPQAPINVPVAGTGTISLVPNQTTTITLVNVSNAICGNGSESGQTVVNIAGTPIISNVETVCDPATNTYQLQIQITGGQSPFTVTGVPGGVVGNTFFSNPIPQSDPYSVTVSDANNCGSATSTGVANCSCVSDAGTMSQDTVRVCINQQAEATQLDPAVLDGNDTLLYILHTSPGYPLGTVLGWRRVPRFPYFPGTTLPGVVYYISAIVGDPNSSGVVNISDNCLSVSLGTPVMWNPIPTGTIFDDTYDVCIGETQDIEVFFTGQAPFQYTYTLNGAPTTLSTSQMSATISATVFQNTSFTLTTVRDANGCTGTATGTGNITAHDAPQIENVQVICDTSTLFYRVEFDVVGGDWPSLVIGGSLGGPFDQTTGHFVSGNLPSTNSYNAVVSDMWLCGTDSISGVPDCICATYAGSMSQTPMRFCPQATATVPATTGAVLDQNDTLIYVIATTPGPPTWTILGTNSVPSFTFNPNFTPETTYYILPVAGNNTPAGIDFGDPCLSISAGTPIIWNKPVTAFLSGNTEICQGDTASLMVTFVGGGPYDFSYVTNSVNPTSLTSPGDTFVLKVNPSLSANYSLTTVNGNGCPGVVSGGAALSVLLPPDLIDLEKECDFNTQTYVVRFKITNGAAPNPSYSVSGTGGIVDDTLFTSFPLPFTTPFSVTIGNQIGCERTISGVSDCSCTSDAGTLDQNLVKACTNGLVFVQHNGNFALDPDDALQYILYQDPTALPNGILATSTNPQFGFLPGMTAGTTYFVSAIVGNKILATGAVDLNDPCLSVSEGTPVLFETGPTATLSGDTAVCPGSTVVFPVNFQGQGPFTVVVSVNGNVNPPVISPQNTFQVILQDIIQNQTVTLISVENTCPGTVNGVATVNLKPIPKGSISGDTKICPGIPTLLSFDLTGASTFDVVISDGTSNTMLPGIQNGFKLEVSPTQTTTYTIVSLTPVGNECTPEIGPGATVTVEDLVPDVVASQQNGFNISCYGAADGFVEASATGGTPPYTFSWNNNSFTAKVEDLAPGTYIVTVTDQKGCSAIDSTSLNEPPPIAIEWTSISPICEGDETGALVIEQIYGGAEPFRVKVGGLFSQAVDTLPLFIDDLAAGNYELEVTDANGCIGLENTGVPAPEPLLVNLGEDKTIAFGDSLKIEGQTNATAIDTFMWSPIEFLRRPDKLETTALPFRTTLFKLTVVDTFGCVGSDEMLVRVERLNRVYVPNIIAVGSGTQNEFFTIFGGAELVRLKFLRIYDRWGECLFDREDLRPSDFQNGWSGYWKEKYVLPGVYVYMAELEFVDGSTEVRVGDLTVIRK